MLNISGDSIGFGSPKSADLRLTGCCDAVNGHRQGFPEEMPSEWEMLMVNSRHPEISKKCEPVLVAQVNDVNI